MLYESEGPLRYSRGSEGGFRLIVEVDKEIVNYYRSILPKWVKSNRQAYAPHISVVRKCVPPNEKAWGKYEGEIVYFYYEHRVYASETYLWLNVFSKRLEEIRAELGLSVHDEFTVPPAGFTKCFHTTIGNFKGL